MKKRNYLVSLAVASLISISLTSYSATTHVTQTPNHISHTKAFTQKKVPITVAEIEKVQKAWGKGIVKIAQAYADKKDYKQLASDFIDKYYAYNYGQGIVLFKPTLASKVPFRATKKDALSYFVTGHISEDKGFALKPFVQVTFKNDEIFIDKNIAIAMGHYYFKNKDGDIAKVEYTLGYVKDDKGNLKIILQHSSLPYQPTYLLS